MRQVRAIQYPLSASLPSRAAERALVIAVLYIVAVLALPAVHLGFHRDDHDHQGGGLHWHLRFSRSSLAGLAHGHTHAPPDASDGEYEASAGVSSEARDAMPQAQARIGLPRSSETSPAGSAHGLGSLAHFACSYLSASQKPLLPRERAAPELLRPSLRSQHVPAAPISSRLWARGPSASRANPA